MDIVKRLQEQDRQQFFSEPADSKHFKRTIRPNSRMTLNKYQGPWTKETTKHLLNRTLFGFNKAQLNSFEQKGLDQSLSDLLEYTSTVQEPVNDYHAYVDYLNTLPAYQGANRIDMQVPAGETWVNVPERSTNGGLTSSRISSLKAWWLRNIIKQDDTIEEKMLLFWHNLLATESFGVFAPVLTYRYVTTMRENSLGDYKKMIKDITLDGAMLIYLNGFLNNKYAPDENYARELQELFTLGKGDNSNYTEEDVQAAARVLTGWRLDYFTQEIFYFSDWHDEGDKTFSSFYGNRVIRGGTTQQDAERELDELLDMIFATDECARYICRRLYQFFVYPEVDDWAENNIIAGLAQTLRSNNFEIKPVLYQLLSSEHFFDSINYGALMKNPIDYYCSMIKNTELDLDALNLNSGDADDFNTYISFFYQISNFGMQLGDPPSVSGWPPYYQTPSYDYLWISSTTIRTRSNQSDSYSYWGLWRTDFLPDPQIEPVFSDFLYLLENYIDDPGDPNALIEELMDNYMIYDENRIEKRDFLKAILLTGQDADIYWTTAWTAYQNDPGNDVFRNEVLWRLRAMMQRFFLLPDYQLH